jgi:hypothetical protein
MPAGTEIISRPSRRAAARGIDPRRNANRGRADHDLDHM